MALIRFRPFSQVLELSSDLIDIQTQMNRLFDGFFGQPSHRGRWSTGLHHRWTCTRPRMSSWSRWSCPGVTEKDIHLSVTGDVLTIQGERQWSRR